MPRELRSGDDGPPSGRFADIVEHLDVPVVSLDRAGRVVVVNRAAERLVGTTRSDLLGRTQGELFPGVDLTAVQRAYDRAVSSGEPARFEEYFAERDAWFAFSVHPGPDGLDVTVLDVTEHRRVERRGEHALAAEEAARGHLALLSEVSEALGSTLDVEEGMRRLARLVVPHLGDWCIVSSVDPVTDAVVDLAVAHRDGARVEEVWAYARERVDALAPTSPVRRAMRTGHPVAAGSGRAEDVEELAATLVTSATAQAMVSALAPAALVVLPLSARGRTVGMLTLYTGADRAPLTREELQTAADVASRAGMALDNAALFTRQRESAVVLQQALLTELPQPDHLELAARYVPSASADQVGGDWYDALVAADGSTTFVIGDVVGHDMGAAASMGQIRALLRAFAWDRDEPPSHLLARLDRAMTGLQVSTMATVLLARVEQDAQDRAEGLRRLRWSSAGHLAPLLVHADGAVDELDAAPDVLLGVAPEMPREDATCVLPPGSTLLLFTDGLVERRDASLTEGVTTLRAALLRHRHLRLPELLDALVDDLVGGAPADDVAVLAVRLHPEDRPRPPEAAPSRP